jgi:hypothetical protein
LLWAARTVSSRGRGGVLRSCEEGSGALSTSADSEECGASIIGLRRHDALAGTFAAAAIAC